MFNLSRTLSASFLRDNKKKHIKRVDIVKEVIYLVAFNTSSGELVLVTRGTVNLLFARDEALRADRILADNATEALLVPLSGLVFHFLGA